ncbi:ATP-dependent DNA helicase PIF1 [Ceratobasidium sp. AG-Ba]|nr:ATP-dependent DNA helicase PIF1 [Ceratobasidium sp. AG-Ba]
MRSQAREADHLNRQNISPDARRIPQPALIPHQPAAGPSNQVVLTNYQIAQRARRNREREEREGAAGADGDGEIQPLAGPSTMAMPNPQAPPDVAAPENRRAAVQQARRRREREQAAAAAVPQAQLPMQNQQVPDDHLQVQNRAAAELEEALPPHQLEETFEARVVAQDARRQVMVQLERQGRQNLGGMSVQCSYCKALHWDAEKLSKSRANQPVFGSCCKQGKIQLPLTKRPPPELYRLFTGTHAKSANFFANIRSFNSSLAFVSMGFKQREPQPPGPGPWHFKIGGEVYHQTGPLTPGENQTPTFAQLYIYDSHEEAANLRSSHPANRECDRALMRELTGLIHTHHPYADIYKQIWQRTSNQNIQAMSMVIRQGRTLDPRRYNRPNNDELALIFPGEGLNNQRDILVHRVGGGVQRIDSWNPAYACLHYVLFWIFGEHGFQRGIPYHNENWVQGFAQQNAAAHENESADEGEGAGAVPNRRGRRTTISELEYYAYLLFPRETLDGNGPMPGPNTHFGTLFRGRRLFQQALVDFWAIVDQSRLIWFRMNQATIRADLYLGLRDALYHDNLEHGADVGTILPSSYYGGARQMAESYQDAMAITRYLGPPQFFVTMTANPNWPEITNALFPGQQPSDRPDIAVRVFELKRRALLDDISKKHVLGRCVAHVHTIEFQKRGLPHMHLLVWVERASHIISPEDVDEVISAELPDPTDQLLYNTVTSTMLHGPCGPDFPDSACWDKEKKACTKGYWPLKPFTPATVLIPNAYPQYRRRNTGRTFRKIYGGREIILDNRSIVPYSPVLSRRYDCHINVETCSGVSAVKYIFKYVYKGRDRASVEIVQQNRQPNDPEGNVQQAVDEIKMYLDARWVSPHEACWRLFAFGLHREFPNIYRLQIHLQDQELVTFRADQRLEDVIANQRDTMLTAFFKLNMHSDLRVRAIANSMVYQEIPSKFSWDGRARVWKLRIAKAGQDQFGLASQRNGGAIGRMYFVSPNQGPKYFTRLLLNVVKKPTSFEDLRRYNNVLYDTERACCVARGLTEDDAEWAICLREASVMKSGMQLRKLFVVILTFCTPGDPHKLWVDFRVHICDDLRYKLQHSDWDLGEITEEMVFDYGLFLIQKVVEEAGSTMERVGLEKCQRDWDQYEEPNRLLMEQMQLQRSIPEDEPGRSEGLLNIQQRAAFDQIYESTTQDQGQTFFLDGPAGTGKTFLYQALCYKIRSQGDIVLCVASSGIAALLLPGGRTSHSRFNIPLELHETSLCKISKGSDLAKLIRHTKLIIWDEVPMQNKFCAEAFDHTCQDICSKPGVLFGGITVVFGGDFRQILPVVRHGQPEDIIAACLKRSSLWPQMIKLRLTENMRLQGDPEAAQFAEFLLQVGEGATIQEGNSGSVPFSPNMHVPSRESLINMVYPNLSELQVQTQEAHDYLREHTILTGRNDDVLMLNNKILEKFPGGEEDTKTYHSVDKVSVEAGVDREEAAMYSPEFLNSLNCTSIPVSKLTLKKGCPIMILRNLSPSEGICNGTRAVVMDLGQQVLQVKLLTGTGAGNTVFLPRITLSSEESDFGFKLERRQFPVRLAFAMTINKSQGHSVLLYLCITYSHIQQIK